MHLYVFGSLCRGEIDFDSDVDILALVESNDTKFNSEVYSVYQYERLRQFWKEGNPFAWHLATESKLIFSDDKIDFIKEMGSPDVYKGFGRDSTRFENLYLYSINSLRQDRASFVSELSNIFLAVRNFASCFALAELGKTVFSRHAAFKLGEYSLEMDSAAYLLLWRARMLSSRGAGEAIEWDDVESRFGELERIGVWMKKLKEVACG